MKKQNFLKGSVILMVSAAIAKLLGALFKIPLANILGGVGMGYFSCAYSLFLPIYGLSVTGLSAAVARLTAQSNALEMYENTERVRKTALKLFIIVGFIGSIITALLAKPFCVYAAQSGEAWAAVVLIAPSVLFGCITAVERGYYEGLCNMYPTAFSQLAEGIFKVVTGLFLCSLVMDNSEYVLQYFPENTDIRAVAAAAAICGVTVSSIAAAIFFPIMRIFTHKTVQKGDSTLINKRDISGNLIAIALPIGLSSVVTNLTALIDMGTIIGCISAYNGNYALPQGTALSEIPQFVYGSFSGIALTVFNLVPSVTNMLGKGILPAITCAWEKRDCKKMEKGSIQALKTAAIMAVPCAVGIGVLSPQILNFLFGRQPEEVAVCVSSLRYLMPGMLCLCISFPVFSMLQAIGKAAAPLKIMIIGAAVKLVGNLILIPRMGVDGGALSTSLCYAIILVISLAFYRKETRIPFKIKPFLSVLFAGLICGVCAVLCRDLLISKASDTLILFGAVFAGGIGYISTLWLCSD